MNLFCAFVRNVTALPAFESVHRFKTLPLAAKCAGCSRGAKWFLPTLSVNHFRCGKQGMLYLLGRSRRPRLFRPARLKKRGGRADRRRCARWRRFPSDCQGKPHSNVRNAVLCRNFSKRGHPCPARFEQERYETDPPANAGAKHPNKKRAGGNGKGV